MTSTLEVYINDLKNNLNKNIFSPSFIRLANLYFMNEQYEECYNICRIGSELYPDYITCKIMIIRTLLKLLYITEAENILSELENKLPELETLKKLRADLNDLKNSPIQERLLYTTKTEKIIEFETYYKEIKKINKLKPSIDLKEIEDIFENPKYDELIREEDFQIFLENYKNFNFETKDANLNSDDKAKTLKDIMFDSDTFLGQVKIVTETLADLLAKQKNYKEAFDAYNILLNRESTNKARILQKLYDIEKYVI